MAAIYLLDTTTFSDLMREHAKVEARMATLSPTGRVFICTIVRGEVRYGLERMPKGRKRRALEAKAAHLFTMLPCESIPEAAGDHYGRIKWEAEKKGARLDENDLWIAATALALDAVLVARDTDFQQHHEERSTAEESIGSIIMTYSDFTFQKLETDLQLTLEEANLYATIPSVEVRGAFVDILEENVPLALSINTEKAHSELIIAPALVELRKVLGHKISLFSGVEFNIDPQKGLNGVCDFIISASPKQILITAPIINVVEAKNENIKGGISQCIAVMYGAQVFNKQKNISTPAVYGVVTTGSSWKFMQLQESVVTIDSMEYFIDNIGKIMGILLHMVSPSSP